MKRGKILVAHGGGPTAVINASLYGVLKEASRSLETSDVYGARFGIEGVLNEDFVDLGRERQSVVELLPYTPSSAIGSCRRKLTEDDYPRLIETFRKHDIRYFLYNGGNDSMDTCHKVVNAAADSGYEINVVGIPKTIDNDLAHTDHCPGYGSAARFVAMTARDLSMEVKAMPYYVTVMETMGRNAGWLAAAASLAKSETDSLPQLVYLPEVQFDEDKFLSDIENWHSRSRGLLVVVSEGLTDRNGAMIASLGVVDGFGHQVPGGVAQALANMISKRLGLSARGEKPGWVGRASFVHQSPVDREEAITVGEFTVRSAVSGDSGSMVALKRISQIPYKTGLELVPLGSVANVEKKFPREWINDEGNGLTDSFVEYARPLIGGPLPEYAELELQRVPVL